jgi:hypothetical protein
MEDKGSARDIAQRIVDSADHIAYLGDALSKGKLPGQWLYGPALELRLRFDRPLGEIGDFELLSRLSSIGIEGPLKFESLKVVGKNLAVHADDLITAKTWRPRGFGFWRCRGLTPMGVKIYPSRRLGVDLLIAVPQPFLRSITDGLGFRSRWELLAESEKCLRDFCRVSAAIYETLRESPPHLRPQAAHLQDQAWCESFLPSDCGFMVPKVVAEACGWEPSNESGQTGWVGVSLTTQAPIK